MKFSLNYRENGAKMPVGPVLLFAKSIFDAVQAEMMTGNPQEAKIAKLTNVQALFKDNPFHAAYGNRDTDIIAYTQSNIPLDRVFRLKRSMGINESNFQTPINCTKVGAIQVHAFNWDRPNAIVIQ